MTINVEIGKALTVTVTDEQLATLAKVPAIHDHVWKIGLRNILMDSHAGQKRELFETEQLWREASRAIAMKKFEAMLRGEIRANSGAPRAPKLDPIAAEALRLARVFILGKLRENESLLESYRTALKLGTDADEKAIKAAAIAARAAKPEVIETARANIESAAKIATDDLGI